MNHPHLPYPGDGRRVRKQTHRGDGHGQREPDQGNIGVREGPVHGLPERVRR
jgi:hypothetical protein